MTARHRSYLRLLLLPAFALVFWLTAVLAGALPALFALGVDVHSLRLADYSGGTRVALAPLSARIIGEIDGGRAPLGGLKGSTATQARQSASANGPAAAPPRPAIPSPRPAPTPGVSPAPTALPTVAPTPTPLPTVVATPTPLPTVVATPTPLPVPIPSLLPLPAPSILPILPSLLPGVFK